MSMSAAQRKAYTQGPTETPIAERVPDHDERAERSVIGAMLIASKAAAVAVDTLMPHHFYVQRNRWLFEKLASLFLTGNGLDEILVTNALRAAKVPDAQLGSIQDYIGRCQQECPTAANIDGYCAAVLDSYERREVLEATLRLQKGIAAGYSLRTLVPTFTDVTNAVLVERETKNAAKDVQQEIEDEISGERMNIAIPKFPCLTTMKALLPGTVTALVGGENSGKSPLLLEWFWRWDMCKVPCALLMLESGLAFHLRRALAQMAERTELLDDGWCKRNPDEARSLRAQWDARIQHLDKSGTVQAMDRRPTCAELCRWMDREARNGRRILAIDPIAGMSSGDKRFLDEQKLIETSQIVGVKYKCSVIFCMHPKEAAPGRPALPDLDRLPGSKDFRKFLDTIFWLSAHKPLEAEFAHLDDYGKPVCDQVKESREYNRTIDVMKKRRAGGWRPKIAANLDGKTMWTTERGWL